MNNQLELSIFTKHLEPESAKGEIIHLLVAIENSETRNESNQKELTRIFRAWKLFLMSRLHFVYKGDIQF